ncbi:hypothetical protein SAMN02799631_00778 [Methylobacterium sp. 174MFSha1.1]|uniref:hypothetical protein n=1 Tax=Methylobacterium sp. 174MFSha1.1 TaxID=1502749 RepID=UPI0008EF665B|nr:hypothetical protein [Methylobacterium sp. 174MFSha1.1]SFU46779.1 hypothetical protein SAMN02799631_00778 [Methylobacterium sp. 174MFSha1.1]
MNVLVFHQGRPHFETALGLISCLSRAHNVTLWSDSLSHFGRDHLVLQESIKLHKSGQYYDAVVVVSGDYLTDTGDLSEDIQEIFKRDVIIRVMHRFKDRERPFELCLFPQAKQKFIPVTTGLNVKRTQAGSVSGKPEVLIQGNLENRRNYDLLPYVADQVPDLFFKLVGLSVERDYSFIKNSRILKNLREIDFHGECAASNFLAPLIDPKKYPAYFKDRFSSSIQIGLSYSIPFIAHAQLLEMYGIPGISYNSDEDLIKAFSDAQKLNEVEIADLKAKMTDIQEKISEENIEIFNRIVEHGSL